MMALYLTGAVVGIFVVLTIAFSVRFIWKYIVVQGIKKKFVNLYYLAALLLLGSDLAIVIFALVSAKSVKEYDMKAEI